MAVNYTPLNGNAGTAIFRLYNRADSSLVSTATINIAEFEEAGQESEFNEVFQNVNDETIKNYYGFKQKIAFTLVNSVRLGSDNLEAILAIATMINAVNNFPQIYRLAIRYRDGAIIQDAVQLGEWSLAEVSKSANLGQSIRLEFIASNSSNIDLFVLDYQDRICQENGFNILLADGGQLLAASFTIPIEGE